MNHRNYSAGDRLLAELDHALRVVAAKPLAHKPTPDNESGEELGEHERRLSASLMRVNHSGEIAAQALYRGQALVARDPELREELIAASIEEHDHLAWCQQRAEELGGRVSILAPFWYAGSFAIGMAAGISGDRLSLGFMAETEHQVTQHLEGHLRRLPDKDARSRAIVEQMRADEIMHGENARKLGGSELPVPVRKVMRAAAKVMTTLSFRT